MHFPDKEVHGHRMTLIISKHENVDVYVTWPRVPRAVL